MFFFYVFWETVTNGEAGGSKDTSIKTLGGSKDTSTKTMQFNTHCGQYGHQMALVVGRRFTMVTKWLWWLKEGLQWSPDGFGGWKKVYNGHQMALVAGEKFN